MVKEDWLIDQTTEVTFTEGKRQNESGGGCNHPQKQAPKPERLQMVWSTALLNSSKN